ncbi:MAG: permease-like cell division protein FtsX, partial [Paludibacteraceae bacterium]|nr:permease-like cell division protein FtsX [Paludibacteraceae bacterium]
VAMKKHHFFNMYFTTTFSIALLLFLVGLVCSLMLMSRSLSRSVRENVVVSVMLSDTITDEARDALLTATQSAGFAAQADYVSKEDALKEHIALIGEDPTEFLDENPLRASLEIKVYPEWATADSLKTVAERYRNNPYVENVIYQEGVVDLMDRKIGTITIVYSAIVLILLLVSLALINNTIRLSAYSKRFLINTMRLVGATNWTIRRPFVLKNMLSGLIAALLALMMLFGLAYYLQQTMGIGEILSDVRLMLQVSAVVVLTGVLLTGVAAYFSAGKYVRMKVNDMYYL